MRHERGVADALPECCVDVFSRAEQPGSEIRVVNPRAGSRMSARSGGRGGRGVYGKAIRSGCSRIWRSASDPRAFRVDAAEDIAPDGVIRCLDSGVPFTSSANRPFTSAGISIRRNSAGGCRRASVSDGVRHRVPARVNGRDVERRGNPDRAFYG